MTSPPWYGGAEIGKTPTVTAFSSSCYLIKLNSLYVGTVLTLLRGRIVANSMSLSYSGLHEKKGYHTILNSYVASTTREDFVP